jgi:OOP family OmpA-OmpF porin
MGEYQQADLVTDRAKMADNIFTERNMNKFLANILAIICISLSPLANADDEDSGGYIGVSVGRTSLNGQYLAGQNAAHLAANGYTYANVDIGQSSTGYKIYWGYQFNRYVTTELIYSDLGSYRMTGYTAGPTYNLTGYTRIRTTGLDIVGMIPVTSKISGLVRLGYAQGKNKNSVSFANGGNSSWTDSNSGTKLGFGAEWEIAHMLHLRIENEYYFNDPNKRIKMVSIGFR